MPQAVSVSFFRFDTRATRAWAFAMMGFGRRALAHTPGIGFWKLCGSGAGEGFDARPNASVYAILATWPDAATARARTADAPLFRRYRARAEESWTVYLTPLSSRGAWAGQAPFAPEAPPPSPSTSPAASPATPGPALAVLTRATLRPATLVRFWRRVPAISRRIGDNPDVAFKIGIGEVPWLHQVTFSIWPDAAAMAAFARSGPHAEAIAAVRRDGWFAEELYARFAVVSDAGTWGGASPLPTQGRT